MKLKNLFTVMAVAALLAIGFEAAAQVPISGAAPAINSNASTNTVVTFPYWPVKVQDGATISNFTKVDIRGKEFVALQFICQATNTTTTSNVVWTVYKGIRNNAVTNAAGTGLAYDVLGYVTNTLNGVTPVSYTATYGPSPKAASTSQSADNGIAGVPYLYIGQVTTTAIGAITNYTVYVNVNPTVGR